ncbi:MAG TPA: TonB-dependent receptor plug domain-containing protein, partial [Elainellaceae cyanobacterium]
MRQLQRLFWLTGMFSVMLASAAQADPLETSTISAPEVVPVEEVNRSEEPEPATTVEEWMGHIEAQEQSGEAAAELAQALTEITNVQVSETESGLELTLEATGSLAEPQTSVVGNALTADIPNARLALPEGEMFEQFAPAAGIALVSAMNLPDGGVRVSITGTDAPPQVEVNTEAGNLVLSVVPGATTAADADDADAIQVVVTATRTEEEIQDVPRSVTVITREQIEEQSNLTTNLQDILGQTVPGLDSPTFTTDFTPRLRGRAPQVLINGVPISSNQDAGFSPLTSIAPSAIERVEVVRGPSAAFGEGATGGVINIITRGAEAEPVTVVETRVNSRGDLAAESFGTYVEYGFSGPLGGSFDGLFNFSWERFGFAFDGAGDQIPLIGFGDENGRSINVLGQLGIDISENQRFQLSVNHFDSSNEVEFINDPTVDDDPDADKARVLERDIEFIC